MSLECSECERDLRGGHDESCSRGRLRADMAYLGGEERFARWAWWGSLRRTGIVLATPLVMLGFALMGAVLGAFHVCEMVEEDKSKCRRIRDALAADAARDARADARGEGA